MAIFAALLTSSAMFTSCGDDDTNNTLPNNDPVIPVTPDEGEAMSPADQKERLETVALDFMAQTPSSDFDAIGNLADYIKDTYVDDYDWDNVGDPVVREKYGVLAGAVGIVLNLLLSP